jgi:TPR repeat protein
MAKINSSTVDTYFQFFRSMDYVPIASSGKTIIDFFLSRFWNPKDFNKLSDFSKAYYNHLSDKESVRYIALIPIFGNAVVMVHDMRDFAVKQVKVIRERQSKENEEIGIRDALSDLVRKNPEQKTKTIESYCKKALSPSWCDSHCARNTLLKILSGTDAEAKGKVLTWLLENVNRFDRYGWNQLLEQPNIPLELRIKTTDLYVVGVIEDKDILMKYDLVNIFKKENQAEKTRIITAFQQAAERGNRKAYNFLIDCLGGRDLTTNAQNAILQWVIKHAETPSSRMHDRAWESVESLYYSLQDDLTITVFSRLVQIEGLSQEKRDFLLSKLDLLEYRGTQEQKRQIFSVYLKMGEKGDLESMYKVGQDYRHRQKNIVSAKQWFERAAARDHLPSIVKLAKLCEERDDIDGAIRWYEKAAGRDVIAALKCDLLKRVRESQKRRTENRREWERQKAEYQNRRNAESENARNAYSRARENARQHYEQERAKAEKAQHESRRKEAADAKIELEKIFGSTFSTKHELERTWRRWSLKGHPDRGGTHEVFTRASNLVEIVKQQNGWN